MITTIALGIVLGGILLMLLPYIIVLGFYIITVPFALIGGACVWIYEKLTK